MTESSVDDFTVCDEAVMRAHLVLYFGDQVVLEYKIRNTVNNLFN